MSEVQRLVEYLQMPRNLTSLRIAQDLVGSVNVTTSITESGGTIPSATTGAEFSLCMGDRLGTGDGGFIFGPRV